MSKYLQLRTFQPVVYVLLVLGITVLALLELVSSEPSVQQESSFFERISANVTLPPGPDANSAAGRVSIDSRGISRSSVRTAVESGSGHRALQDNRLFLVELRQTGRALAHIATIKSEPPAGGSGLTMAVTHGLRALNQEPALPLTSPPDGQSSDSAQHSDTSQAPINPGTSAMPSHAVDTVRPADNQPGTTGSAGTHDDDDSDDDHDEGDDDDEQTDDDCDDSSGSGSSGSGSSGSGDSCDEDD